MTKVEMTLIFITQQEIQILKDKKMKKSAIMKKSNSAGLKVILTSTAIIDNSKQFSNFYLFWEKELVINSVDI